MSSLEMRMISQPEMGFFYLTQDELSREIEELSPLLESIFPKEDIIAYLTQLNCALITARSAPEEIAREYVTAASIYTFVRSLLHLDISQNLPDAFTRLARKSPFKVKNPLEIVFQDATSYEPVSSLENLAQPLIIIEESDLDPEAVFARSERFKHKIRDSVRLMSGNLLQSYTREHHFAFIGLYEICFPLFGLRKKDVSHDFLSHKLRKQYGSFGIQFPCCLADTLAIEPSSLQ